MEREIQLAIMLPMINLYLQFELKMIGLRRYKYIIAWLIVIIGYKLS